MTDSLSKVSFGCPYPVIPHREKDGSSTAVVDVNLSGKMEPRDDVRLYARVIDKDSKEARYEPIKFDRLKEGLEECHGRATADNLDEYLKDHHKTESTFLGISLGGSHLPAVGCMFSLYDNDSKICMKLVRY